MTRIGFFLVIIPLLAAFILDKFFLIDLLRRSNGQKPAFGEIVHMIFTGVMFTPFKKLLKDAGLEPTIRDKFFHYLIMFLGWLVLVGFVLLIIGMARDS